MFIRFATEVDLPAIVAIYNSTVASRMVTADTDPVSVESRLPWFCAHSEESRPLWVLDAGGQIAGWMSFQSFYGRPAYQATVEVSVYVAEEFRRQNLGRLLLNKAKEAALTVKVENLVGFIFGHNEPSLRLFKSCGFQEWGFLPKIAEMDGQKYDLAIYGLQVS